jgi:hypothetical protein
VLRTFVTALLLLTLPLAQARALVLCAMSPTPTPAHCTCPHEHHTGHATDHGAPPTDEAGDCCEVEFAPVAQPIVAASPAAPPQADVLADPDDVPIAIVPSDVARIFPLARAAPAPVSIQPHRADQSRLYLTTVRLRL